MSNFVRVDADGNIVDRAIGFEIPPFEDAICVGENIINQYTQYQYVSGEWVIARPEPPSPDSPQTIYDRVAQIEEENIKLKAELEVTQAVVDELLFGGVTV